MKTLKSLIFCLVFLLGMHSNALAAPNSQATLDILYVKESASGDCSSWANACDLQTALTNAGYDDEIWVAAGTYKPTVEADPNPSNSNLALLSMAAFRILVTQPGQSGTGLAIPPS